jgi:DNA mismatch repair protein MSH6
MDELGRGTSTFDGTAIASAVVKHLVERSQCLSLFATHYHTLLDEWKEVSSVRLGHMECVVDNGQVTSRTGDADETNITFLYTLGSGVCPKSFGINVARLAGLPDDVLQKAKRISAEFELDMSGEDAVHKHLTARSAPGLKRQLLEHLQRGDLAASRDIYAKLRES